jgi:hypothetical protein
MRKTYLIVCLILFSVLVRAQNNNWQDKIDSELWLEAQNSNKIDFFILMKDQAKTTDAKFLKTKEEKAAYVFNALRTKAEETQGELLRNLSNQGVEFRSFFIVNGILVKGNLNRSPLAFSTYSAAMFLYRASVSSSIGFECIIFNLDRKSTRLNSSH